MKQSEVITDLAPSILVLTDFSEASKEALRWAGHLASNHNAKLRVLYPYRLTQLNGKDDALMSKKNIEAEARSSFAKMAEGVFNGTQPSYDFKAEVGFINDRVHSFTRQTEVLLVVISKRMANTNREALNELLDHLHAPLLIVPASDAA